MDLSKVISNGVADAINRSTLTVKLDGLAVLLEKDRILKDLHNELISQADTYESELWNGAMLKAIKIVTGEKC